MYKKRALVIFLLAALILAGLFGPLLQGQGVSAAPSSSYTVYINLSILSRPPAKMCLGTTTYITIAYQIKQYQTGTGRNPGLTPVPPAGRYALYAKATKGTFSPESAWLNGLNGSGTILATYKATEKGIAKISLYGPNISEETIPFTVVECTWKVIIEADERNAEHPVEQYIRFNGEGGINANIDPASGTGLLTGGGTYRYMIVRTFQNPNPKLTCAAVAMGAGDSTFSIIHGTLLANSVTFGIQLASVTIPTFKVQCTDAGGNTVEVPAGEAITVKNPTIPEFSSLVFTDGVSYLPFAFGDGTAGVYLVQRKGH